MTWYAVYRISDGKLISTTTTEPDETLPAHLAYVDVGEDTPSGTWNTSTLTFDPPAPRRTLPVLDFVNRFTGPEALDAFGTDLATVTNVNRNKRIRGFRWYLNAIDDVDLDHNFTNAGMESFVTQGWLTEARKLEILGDVTS